MIYTESELVIPALRIIDQHPEGVSTEFLIKELTVVLHPEGKDAEILAGRNDTHFSQKVRNLKSHDTFEKKDLASYRDGLYFITDKGREYLNAGYDEVAEALRKQGFDEKIRDQEFGDDYKNIVVEEGFLSEKNVTFRSRSRELTRRAKEYFRKDGNIPCDACDFDFLNFYGERGRDYIEIHHTHPIHQHDVSGERLSLEDALSKLAPLCSNCHRMVHRKRDDILSVQKLKEIIKNAKPEK
jgi:hypothetical protein